MGIRATRGNFMIIAPLFLVCGGVIAWAGDLAKGIPFMVIGALALVAVFVRRDDNGPDVASEELQRKRRERFGGSRRR